MSSSCQAFIPVAGEGGHRIVELGKAKSPFDMVDVSAFRVTGRDWEQIIAMVSDFDFVDRPDGHLPVMVLGVRRSTQMKLSLRRKGSVLPSSHCHVRDTRPL